MFVHINPEINSFGETISTLKFAERVASIELGAARANKETAEVRDLKEEISKLKSALETKESEVVQLKDYNCRIAMEVNSLRAASPLHMQKQASNLNLKPEDSQRPASDARQTESRSCSFGKQRKPRFPSVLSDKEHDSRSPFSAEENRIKSRNRRSPSPVIRSFYSDRSTIVKSKPRGQSVDASVAVKLQFPDKASTDKSISNIPMLLSNGSIRRVFSEHEQEQLKPTLLIRRFKAETKNASTDTGGRIEARKKSDFSETENECNVIDSPVNCSLREKKLQQYGTRASQNIEPRAFLHTVEPLISMKHENKPPTSLFHTAKERSKTTEPEVRRSRSLPRGKFSIS